MNRRQQQQDDSLKLAALGIAGVMIMWVVMMLINLFQ